MWSELEKPIYQDESLVQSFRDLTSALESKAKNCPGMVLESKNAHSFRCENLGSTLVNRRKTTILQLWRFVVPYFLNWIYGCPVNHIQHFVAQNIVALLIPISRLSSDIRKQNISGVWFPCTLLSLFNWCGSVWILLLQFVAPVKCQQNC